MFASLKTSIAASLAALTFGIALSASPADAGGFRMGGVGGSFHGGLAGLGPHHVGWGWRHHGWVPGLGLGLAAAGAAASSCIVYQPVYDDYGNYLGRYPVNVCQ
jgi:hypothetical protein